MRSLLSAGCVALSLLVAACGTTPGTATAVQDTSVTERPPTSAPPSTTVGPTSVLPANYDVVYERVTGSNGPSSWDVQLPQLTGGNPAATAEFNESMRAALDDRIGDDYGTAFRLSGDRSTVTHIGDSVISGLLLTDWDAIPPGAHGSELVSTVVIDSSTGRPVTLADVFPDEKAGLKRLSDLAQQILPTVVPNQTFEGSGTEPIESNFANWQATPEGMEIHFSDYQVGAYALGLVTITVPWMELRPVMDVRLSIILPS